MSGEAKRFEDMHSTIYDINIIAQYNWEGRYTHYSSTWWNIPQQERVILVTKYDWPLDEYAGEYQV